MQTVLLAIDTSGKNGGLALARVTPNQAEFSVLETVPLTGGSFSAELVPQLANLLAKHGHSKNDLAGFAVVSGPGSFTGLRVGLAAIKGLAEALQKPIAAISLLEAIACSGQTRGRVLAVLDAGRGDLYVGDYELADGALNPRMISERLLTREEFVAEISRAEANRSEGINIPCMVTSDAALAQMFQAPAMKAGIKVELVEPPTIAIIARMGWKYLQEGRTVLSEALEANYIRRPDAEIFSKPKP